MPFGIVSAWNKRRSKSHDAIDPCMGHPWFCFL